MNQTNLYPVYNTIQSQLLHPKSPSHSHSRQKDFHKNSSPSSKPNWNQFSSDASSSLDEVAATKSLVHRTAMDEEDEAIMREFAVDLSSHSSSSFSVEKRKTKSKRRSIIESDSEEESFTEVDPVNANDDIHFTLQNNIKDKKHANKNHSTGLNDDLAKETEKQNEMYSYDSDLQNSIHHYPRFKLPDCFSSSSSSEEEEEEEEEEEKEDDDQETVSKPQPNPNYHSVKSATLGTLSNKDESIPQPVSTLFSSCSYSQDKPTIRMGVHGTSIQSPTFNIKSRSWFQKKSPSKKRKRFRQSKIEFLKKETRKDDSLQQGLCNITVTNHTKQFNMDDYKNIEIVDVENETNRHVSFHKHENYKMDTTKHNYPGNDLLENDCVVIGSSEPSREMIQNNSKNAYEVNDSTDDIQSFHTENDDEGENDLDGDYQYKSDHDDDYSDGNDNNKETFNIRRSEICNSHILKRTTRAQSRQSNHTQSQTTNNRKIGSSSKKRSKTEFIQIGGKHGDLWMKPSSSTSTSTSLSKSRAPQPLRNDLRGGSGVGIGGVVLLGNNEESEGEDSISYLMNENNSNVMTKNTAKTSTRTKKATSSTGTSKRKTRRYKSKQSTNSSSSWGYKRGKKKGGATRYRKRYSTSKYGKNSYKKNQNAWSNREKGFGSYNRGNGGGSYMQISKQDPQLGNDGGANITF